MIATAAALVKLLLVHQYIVDFFPFPDFREYWVQAEIGTPTKLALGGVRIVAFSISHEQTQ